MADYSEAWSVHETLSANAIDFIELTDVGSSIGSRVPGVTVVNRTGTAEIYGTWSTGGNAQPADPTIAGANTFVVPAAIGSITLPAAAGPVYIKLISSGAEAYSVEAL